MKYTSASRLFNTLKNVVLFLALVHVSILSIYAFLQWNSQPLNIFYILHLNVMFPSLVQGGYSEIFSFVIFAVLFFIFFLIQTRSDSRILEERKVDKEKIIPYDNSKNRV